MCRLGIVGLIVAGGLGLAVTAGCAPRPVKEDGTLPQEPGRTVKLPFPPAAPTPLETAARKAKVQERTEGEWWVTGEARQGAPRGEMGIPDRARMAKVVPGGMMEGVGGAGGGMMGGPGMMGGAGGAGGLKAKMALPAAPPGAAAPTRSRRMAMGAEGPGPGPRLHQPGDAPRTPSLTAGEVDDHALFEKYLRYEKSYQAGGGVHRFDPQERYVIRVVDSQGRGVPDALVTLANSSAPEVPLFRGRTTAAGKLVFFPEAYGLSHSGRLTLTAYKNGAKAAETASRQPSGGTWTLSLKEPWIKRAGMPLDVLFVVGTTGSMGEEIDRIRDTIQEVSQRIWDLEGSLKLRLGIVLYRDRGDDYLTKRLPFTEDVSAFEAALQDVRAGGGGDTPEDINSALQQAVEAMNWYDGEALRLMFLIADAPPHLDYGQEYDYFLGARRAVEKGIKIFAVSTSGMDDVGEFVFRQIALLTLGRFVFVTKGGPVGITPHHVDRSDFSVENLDDLIVRLVSQEVVALGRVL